MVKDPIIHPYQIETIQQEQISQEQQVRNQLFYQGNRRKGKDGRTYNYIDDRGEYISNFVSQYSNIIQNNIEPKIKDLVLGLHERGYLTWASCQGHLGDQKRRWVGLAFNDITQKNLLMREINDLNLPIYFYNNHVNSRQQQREEGKWFQDGLQLHIPWTQHNYKQLENIREATYSNDDMTKFWNIMFQRNYNEYHSTIMSVGYPIVRSTAWKTLKQNLFYDWKYVDKITDILTDKISTLSYYTG
jgi:hypothetical protein